MTAQRKRDAIFLIRQENDTSMLMLVDADESAAELMAGKPSDFKDKPFFNVLGASARDYFREAMDFEDAGGDFGDACQKLRDLRLRSLDGREFSSPFSVERTESPDGHGWFRLVIPTGNQRQVRESLSNYLREHFQGTATINPETQLLSGNAAESYADMLKNTLPAHEMQGCCALLRLDRYAKSMGRYGKSGVIAQLQHMANCCKSTFRAEDVVCQIDDHTLAIFLIDIDHEAARIVLNRLRWNIRNHRIPIADKEYFSVTVSVVFGSLLSPGENVLERCKATLSEVSTEERNMLVEMEA